MLYSGQKALENFFKRHRFRKSRRFRTSFRASIICRPRSTHRTTPTNQEASKTLIDSRKVELAGKSGRTRQVEVLRQDTITTNVPGTLSDSDNNVSPFNRIIDSKASVSKVKKCRPKTADTHMSNNKNKIFKKHTDRNININKNENNNTTYSNINNSNFNNGLNLEEVSCGGNTNDINDKTYDNNNSACSTFVPSEVSTSRQHGHKEELEVNTKMVDLLKNEIRLLRKEVATQRETIQNLQNREKQLQFRLSEQARKQMEKGSSKFEDLSLGNNRPTQLIKRFGNLYSEARVEALDGLEELPEVRESEDLKCKLLLSILVLSFRSAQKTLLEIKEKLRELLQLSRTVDSRQASMSAAARNLEDEVALYLRKTVDKFNPKKNVAEVSERIWSTLHDYPVLRTCKPLKKYIEECVTMAWSLSVQRPPLVIDYETGAFEAARHSRFHTSDPESQVVKSCLWPALLEGEECLCVCKGIVLT